MIVRCALVRAHGTPHRLTVYVHAPHLLRVCARALALAQYYCYDILRDGCDHNIRMLGRTAVRGRAEYVNREM